MWGTECYVLVEGFQDMVDSNWFRNKPHYWSYVDGGITSTGMI